jgi:colanic acid/amylovoran biosynthesis glycosyltransferase
MVRVAYLANQFPSAVEPYVSEEIEELRRRGVQVIAGSVRKPDAFSHRLGFAPSRAEILCLQPVRVLTLLRAIARMVKHWQFIGELLSRALLRGKESPKRRLKALLHTWLGAYYAVLLQKRGAEHIHVHHGYFGSWIAMVAARLLGIGYSLTLHGSDLLVNGSYLDVKLKNCRFCVTISEYNHHHIQERFTDIDPLKIVVSRLGVDVPERAVARRRTGFAQHTFSLLSVGRLHAVKDHAFLIRACARLRDCGLDFTCAIAGDGPERQHLSALLRQNRLEAQVTLLGHVSREQVDSLYLQADVIVLTSRSEGLPLVLMEAMARGGIVLAPAITGIPEIVIPGKTGFLYAPEDLEDFVARVVFLQERICGEGGYATSRLDWIRHAARLQVLHNFNRRKNLTQFVYRFLQRTATQDFTTRDGSSPHEDFVLQQIQLSV